MPEKEGECIENDLESNKTKRASEEEQQQPRRDKRKDDEREDVIYILTYIHR